VLLGGRLAADLIGEAVDLANSFFFTAVVGHGGRAVPAAAVAAGRRELAGIRRRGRHPLLRRRRQDHQRTFQVAVGPSFSTLHLSEMNYTEYLKLI
jgi:hypothetical protein